MLNFKEITSLEQLINHKQSMIEIGNGAFGTVFKFISKCNQVCAVKQMRIANNKFLQERIDQLNKEKEFLCKHHHRNIVKAYFGFLHQENINLYYYLGMEFIDKNLGTLLENNILNRTEFSDEALFNYALQLCDALYFLQIKNIAHQDLKPENILIDNENNLKICDFSEFRSNTDAFKSLIASQVVGTASYMAPELIRGDKNIIPIKCDVYSYGITILQCYLGCTFASMKCFNEKDGQANLDITLSNFSTEMKYFFKKCLSHSPMERFDFLDIKIFLQAKLDCLSIQDKEKLNNFTEDIKELQKKNQSLEASNNFLLKNYDSLLKKNDSLEKKNDSLEKKKDFLEKGLKTLANECQTQKSQLASLTDVVQGLQKELYNSQRNEEQMKKPQQQQESPKKIQELINQPCKIIKKDVKTVCSKCQDNQKSWENKNQNKRKYEFQQNTKLQWNNNYMVDTYYNYNYMDRVVDSWMDYASYFWNDRTGKKEDTYWIYEGKAIRIIKKDIPKAIKIIEEVEQDTSYEFGLCLMMLHSNLWNIEKSKNDLKY